MTPLIHKYLRSVRRRLVCSRASKERLCAPLAASLSAFAEETPNLTHALLVETFGAPEEAAASLQANVPPEEKKAILRRRTIFCVLFVLVFLCVMIYAVKMSYSSRQPIYVHEEIIHGESREVDCNINNIVEPPDEYW